MTFSERAGIILKTMAFDGREGGQIELETAAAWTKNYRKKYPNDTKGHFLGKDIINDILDQTGCMGIRIYYALDGDDKKELILAGAVANEDDLDSGVLAEFAVPCPPVCGRHNTLNS